MSEILQGVSLRLGSPLQAIRRQAMRVGRAFARKLNAKQPLFEDQGCLDLLPEEVWAGALDTAEFENRASTNSAANKNNWCENGIRKTGRSGRLG